MSENQNIYHSEKKQLCFLLDLRDTGRENQNIYQHRGRTGREKNRGILVFCSLDLRNKIAVVCFTLS